MSPTEVTDKLQLSKLKDRVWYVVPSCATTGEGLFEGLVSPITPHNVFGTHDTNRDGSHRTSNPQLQPLPASKPTWPRPQLSATRIMTTHHQAFILHFHPKKRDLTDRPIVSFLPSKPLIPHDRGITPQPQRSVRATCSPITITTGKRLHLSFSLLRRHPRIYPSRHLHPSFPTFLQHNGHTTVNYSRYPIYPG